LRFDMRLFGCLLMAWAAGACASGPERTPEGFRESLIRTSGADASDFSYYSVKLRVGLFGGFLDGPPTIVTESYRAAPADNRRPTDFKPLLSARSGEVIVGVGVEDIAPLSAARLQSIGAAAEALASGIDAARRRAFDEKGPAIGIDINLVADSEQIDHRFISRIGEDKAAFIIVARVDDMDVRTDAFMMFTSTVAHEAYHAATIVRLAARSRLKSYAPYRSVPSARSLEWPAYAKATALEEAAAGLFSECAFLAISDSVRPMTAIPSKAITPLTADEKREAFASLARVIVESGYARLTRGNVSYFGYFLADALWRRLIGDKIHLGPDDPDVEKVEGFCAGGHLAEPHYLEPLIEALLANPPG
jgi:hypothetical protein